MTQYYIVPYGKYCNNTKRMIHGKNCIPPLINTKDSKITARAKSQRIDIGQGLFCV